MTVGLVVSVHRHACQLIKLCSENATFYRRQSVVYTVNGTQSASQAASPLILSWRDPALLIPLPLNKGQFWEGINAFIPCSVCSGYAPDVPRLHAVGTT